MGSVTRGLFSLLLATGSLDAAPGIAGAAVHLSLEPDSTIVQPGDTVTVQLTVPQAESEFNAFDVYLQFDPARLQFLPSTPVDLQIGPVMKSDCSTFFHQFAPHPDNLEIHLSLLCNNTFETGPGVIYQVRFRVLDVLGRAVIACGAGTEFYRAGFFVRPVDALPMVLFVGGTDSVEPIGAGGAAPWLATPRPNPWRGRGEVRLSFSLPAPERVGFAVIDTQGRRVAERAPEEFGAGVHVVSWSGLRLSPGRYLVKMSAPEGTGAARAWVVTR